MKKYPEPIVGVFIFNPEGQLFLMKSHKWSGKYVVPGGHIELGEKIEDAIRRETLEETSLTVSDPKFVCLWEFISEGEYFKKSHMIFLNYKVLTRSEKVILNDEAEEFSRVTPNDSLKLDLNKYTRLTIEKYLI